MSEEQTQEASFLDLALDEVPELSAVDGDIEYRLRITKVDQMTSKGEKTRGQQLLLFRMDIVDEPDTKQVTYPVMLPDPSLTQDDNNDRKRQLKRLLKAFGWDVAKGFNPQELVGLEGFALLGKEVSPEYGEQNNIKRLIDPAD